MRALIVFLVVVALAGAAFGSYAIFVQPLPKVASAEGEGQCFVTAEQLQSVQAQIEQTCEARIEELEGVIGQQAKRIAKLNNEVAALRNGAPVAARPAGEAAPLTGPLAGADREALKEQLGQLMDEHKRDERQKQSDRMQKEAQDRKARQIEKTAEKYKWDDQKKQQVMDILAQEKTSMEQLYEDARNRELSQEQRKELGDKMRELRNETQEALKALLSEEEYGSVQKALNPRRERGRSDRGDRFRPGRRGGGR